MKPENDEVSTSGAWENWAFEQLWLFIPVQGRIGSFFATNVFFQLEPQVKLCELTYS